MRKEPLSPIIEGEDYYWEDQLMVFTNRYHLRRGYCCGSGCRHCPYYPKATKKVTRVRDGEREAK